MASLFDTLVAELLSVPELSVDDSRLLRGLYSGFSGDLGGGVAVGGRTVTIPVLGVEWAVGSGVLRDEMALLTWSSELRGGCGMLIFGVAGRAIVADALGVALLQSTLPSGKFNL